MEAEAVLVWAADRCEAVAHRYLTRDEALSEAADRCKDAVRALSAAECADGFAARARAVEACTEIASSVQPGRAVVAVRECIAAISDGWPSYGIRRGARPHGVGGAEA